MLQEKIVRKYFVENEDAWEMFKDNVWDAVQKEIDDPLVWKNYIEDSFFDFRKICADCICKIPCHVSMELI